jgi:hypothetical protein
MNAQKTNNCDGDIYHGALRAVPDGGKFCDKYDNHDRQFREEAEM